MAGTFALVVVASNKIFYDGRAELLGFRGIDGEMAVLAHHENAVIAVAVGEIRIKTADGQWIYAVSGCGFARIIHNEVLFIVDTVERPEDIDVIRAERAKERAQEQLRQEQSMFEHYHSEASLSRAISRLKATGKYLNGGVRH